MTRDGGGSENCHFAGDVLFEWSLSWLELLDLMTLILLDHGWNDGFFPSCLLPLAGVVKLTAIHSEI